MSVTYSTTSDEWYAYGYPVTGSVNIEDAWFIFGPEGRSFGRVEGFKKEHAVLMAAAPNLRKALMMMMELNKYGPPSVDNATVKEWDEAMKTAQDALNKAGKDPSKYARAMPATTTPEPPYPGTPTQWLLVDDGIRSITLNLVKRPDGPPRYAIRDCTRLVLDRIENEFVYEYMASHYGDEFYASCRFDTIEEAMAAFQAWKDKVKM